MRTIAVIPAYNEAKTIGAVVRSVLEKVDMVVVVSDASKDGTERIAKEAGAQVVVHETNKGFDQAINNGFAEARRLDADIILTIDADGEHDANDIPKMLAPLEENSVDIVLGQRPHTTHFCEAIFSLYTRLRFGVKDPLCGFKAYRSTVYDAVGFFDSFGSIGTELAFRGIKKGFRVALVPIALRKRENDTSRFYAFAWHGNMKILRAMWRTMVNI